MSTKLGPHIIKPSDSALRWAKRAPIVKCLDDTKGLWEAPGGSIRIFRKFFPNQDIAVHGSVVVQQVLGALGNAPATHIELYNECAQRLGQGLERHVEMTREAVQYLREVRPDLTIVGFSFSTGNPEPEDWWYLQKHGFGEVSLISLHQYWGNEGFSVWNACRHRMVHGWLDGDHPPMIITECGRDRVEGGKGGWKLDGIPEEQYLAELRAYDQQIKDDLYILGATPFTSGPTPDWGNFSMDEISARMEGGEPPVAWTPQEAMDRISQELTGQGWNEGTALAKAFVDYPGVFGVSLTTEISSPDWPFVLMIGSKLGAAYRKSDGKVLTFEVTPNGIANIPLV